MPQLTLKVIKQMLTIHRYAADSQIPVQVYDCEFYSITRTDEELSIVCSATVQIKGDSSSTDWLGFKVQGPLDFSLTGILAELSAVLAQASISIFAISTYDTDYILVKADKMQAATRVLEDAGYLILPASA